MKIIWLTQGQFTLVDDKDYEYLKQYKWHAVKTKRIIYAARRGNNNSDLKIFMHRIILGITNRSTLADHIDHNGLNNQRSNLRIADYRQNACNVTPQANLTSKYLGVWWSTRDKRWKSAIQKDKKVFHLGYFKNETDAALAYNSAAIKMHGEFANLNNIQ